MYEDPIVEEIRRIRHEHAARFNNDLAAIVEDIRQIQRIGPHLCQRPTEANTGGQPRGVIRVCGWQTADRLTGETNDRSRNRIRSAHAHGRAGRGTLRFTRPDELAAIAMRAAIERAEGLSAGEIEDVIVGCATPEAEQGMNVARIAMLRAGIPASVPPSRSIASARPGWRPLPSAASASSPARWMLCSRAAWRA